MKEISDVSQLPSGNDQIPLGSGTVVGVLGSGGMARVYKIWNEKLEVHRAVKILLPTQQKDLKNRFETEAKITAKLHHPNIVEIYAVGDWKGLPFLEMEYIDGDSLEALIVRYGKLPHSVCSAIAIFIARALVYAHGQEFLIYGKNYHGVIHRDLKPANIMIAGNGDVKLMDFGIARPTEASLHTVEGNIVGTMQYLSPEQIDGVDIDARTDLYSFGAILYEMLTGTKTFPQETITNLMKKKIVNEYRKFSDFNFPIAPGLVKITQKCLQSSKESRYPAASALLKDLESVHKSLTIDEPALILHNYLKDPATFNDPAHTKIFRLPFANPRFRRLLLPVSVIGLALAIAATFAFILVTKKPSLEQSAETKPSLETATNQTATVAQQTGAAVPQTSTIDASELTPLPGGTTAQTAVEPPPRPPVVKNRPVSPTVKIPRTSVSPKDDPAAGDKGALSVDKLAAKYGTGDLLEIGRSALKSGKSADAIFALEKMGDNVGDQKMKTLLLFEAYVEAGRTKDGLFIATSQTITDAQFDYLCGRLHQALNKHESALDYYEKALTRPSIVRSRNEIRNDAMYYSALIRSDRYRKNPGPDNRVQVENAWNVVKRLYGASPDHSRFRQAQSELSLIQ
ncbi:MAG: protein kinase [Chitinispirillaceae bacterium]|nr:protein kinase [Chitinispirillaceae bacterium]